MPYSQLVGEGINGKHMHSYQETETGNWQWCADCQCFVTSPCLHNEYICCYERSTYIRLRAKYEVCPTQDAADLGKAPAKKASSKPVRKSTERASSQPAPSG